MNLMWFTHDTPISCYNHQHTPAMCWEDSPAIKDMVEVKTIQPDQWIDVDEYPQLKPYCLTDEEYAMKRLLGDL